MNYFKQFELLLFYIFLKLLIQLNDILCATRKDKCLCSLRKQFHLLRLVVNELDFLAFAIFELTADYRVSNGIETHEYLS